MADLLARTRLRTKASGLLLVFGFAFEIAMAVKDNKNYTLAAFWTLGTFIDGWYFIKWLFEDLKRAGVGRG